MANPYDNPEKCGLEILVSLNDDNLSYEFNMLLIFKHKETGRLFWQQDSG